MRVTRLEWRFPRYTSSPTSGWKKQYKGHIIQHLQISARPKSYSGECIQRCSTSIVHPLNLVGGGRDPKDQDLDILCMTVDKKPTQYKPNSWTYNLTISLRFLGIILRVLRPWSFLVQCFTLQTSFIPLCSRGGGGRNKLLVEVTVSSKEENSQDFFPITFMNMASVHKCLKTQGAFDRFRGILKDSKSFELISNAVLICC